MTHLTSQQQTRFRIIRSDRASHACPPPGTIVYTGRDAYGSANDDSRRFDIEFIACSMNPSGEPFFTIPRVDVQPVRDTKTRVPFAEGPHDEIYYQGLAWLDTL